MPKKHVDEFCRGAVPENQDAGPRVESALAKPVAN